LVENFKSSYKDAVILSFLFITLGGFIAFSLYLVNLIMIAFTLILFITYQSSSFFKTTFDYNRSLEDKKHLFVMSDRLNSEQKQWFLIKMDEEINKKRKPIFWDQEAALAVYYYLTKKINSDEPLTDHEQYVLNLFLIDYLDLDQIARNWIKIQ
jgi:hypothetical protein